MARRYSDKRPIRSEETQSVEKFTGKSICAILTADWHLSLNPPIARSVETDWLAVQAGYLRQIAVLAEKHECPVVVAGDIFDKWNSPPAIINLALSVMPHVYSVPGNHDLPNHLYEDAKKSAYWTLVESGKITDIKPNQPISVGNLRLHGFPSGTFAVFPLQDAHGLALEIAVIHAYCWDDRKSYPNAPEIHHVSKWAKRLRGFDVGLFGDNHTPFEIESDTQCTIFNCGGLQRRRSDEKDHRPSVGLLHENGRIERHYLDVSTDKFADRESYNNGEETSGEINQFVKELEELGDKSLDFPTAINLAMDKRKVSKEQRAIILTAMDSK